MNLSVIVARATKLVEMILRQLRLKQEERRYQQTLTELRQIETELGRIAEHLDGLP